MIDVTNEIGDLEKVLVHKPGGELENLTPELLDRLLFDDIPFLNKAQQEHDSFVSLLRSKNVKVYYLKDLVAQTLDLDKDIKKQFVYDIMESSGNPLCHLYKEELYNYLSNIEDTRSLVQCCISGISEESLTTKKENPLLKLMKPRSRFILDPIPNLYFTRDVFATIGNGVSINHMYSATRRRESLFGRYIFSYHKEFCNTPIYYHSDCPYYIEGGDIINISKEILFVGVSQRTSPEAIMTLSKNLFESETSKIKTVVAIQIPNTRAFMHLDTVFNQADYDKFIIHPNILENLRIYKIENINHSLKVEEFLGSLDYLLKDLLHLDRVHMIYCGGDNSVTASREQWNDGSNLFCLKPGEVVVYDRNMVTNHILRDHGIKTYEIESSELSRGRGGAHCMTMPLVRRDICNE